LSNLKSTQPCLIKVTDQIPISDNKADKKALQTAKTGKVTAVVVVMHLYGDSKIKVINTNATNSANLVSTS
jgi:hypothetical protein